MLQAMRGCVVCLIDVCVTTMYIGYINQHEGINCLCENSTVLHFLTQVSLVLL